MSKKPLIIGGIVVTLLGAGALFGYYANVGKHDSEVAVIGPGQPIEFTVDGGEVHTVGAKGRKIVKVTPGEHVVKILKPAPIEHKVTVPEFKRMIVPGIKDQCFAKLDVSLSHYGQRHKKIPPSFREFKQSSTPFELSKSHYLHPNALPNSNKDGTQVWLYRSASCETVRAMQAAQKIRTKKLLGK